MTVQSTLITSAVFALIGAMMYLYIGWWLSKRVIAQAKARLAWQAFTTWWFALAITTLLGACENLLGALGLTDLSLFVTANYVNLLVSCIALWGLVYYLIYLFTGNSRPLVSLIIFYLVYYVLLVYYYTASAPTNVEVGRWNTSIVFNNSITGPFFVILVAFLLFPQVIGSLAYFTLYFKVSDVTQKYRILLVSWSIIVWFLSPLIGLVGDVSEQDWWQLLSRVISLGAAAVILMAYLPPVWIKQRFGIASLNEEGPQT